MSAHESRIDLTLHEQKPKTPRTYLEKLQANRQLLATLSDKATKPGTSVNFDLSDALPGESNHLFEDLRSDIAKLTHENRPGFQYYGIVVPLNDGNQLSLVYGGLRSADRVADPTQVTLVAFNDCNRDEAGQVTDSTVTHLSAYSGILDPSTPLAS